MQYFTDASAGLREAFEREVLSWPDVSVQTTFGCPSYRVDDARFAVLSDQGVSLTCLPDDERRSLAATHRLRPFVSDGRAVSSWTTVSVTPETVDSVLPAVRQGYEAAKSV